MTGKNKDLCLYMQSLIPDHIFIQQLSHPLLEDKKIKLSIARLDLVHPVISGNKLFKLRYYLEEALKNKLSIRTFGGAYSNHLVATAYACAEAGISCTGIVRGERPAHLSHTLLHCIDYGMKLQFVSREEYTELSALEDMDAAAPEMHIPEGGFGFLGAKGAADILPLIQQNAPTYICCAVGTATTLSGLMMKRSENRFIAVPVLKDMYDITHRIEKLVGPVDHTGLTIWDDYHFGGYAKYNAVLLDFMNAFYTTHSIPLDFVYTAKMMFAVMDNIEKNYFKAGDNIVCLHTGGLQGNDSLKPGTLIF
ncbi:MAG: pyridoxal-phosphate dependent enzyme [Ferruginibacter sp.]